jgi:hypothetical protein
MRSTCWAAVTGMETAKPGKSRSHDRRRPEADKPRARERSSPPQGAHALTNRDRGTRGEPVGGVKRLEYTSGERMPLHRPLRRAGRGARHGYDRMKTVGAAGSVRFDVPPRLEGIFEVELEERGEQIAELRVAP